ncbi:ImmA/IrrE family metallo-endopeptidase [Aliarcobacter butzleri]
MNTEKYKDFINKEINTYKFIDYLKEKRFDYKVPVNIEEIINFLSIEIKNKPDFRKINVTGNITVKNGIPSIWINPMQNKMIERKRFTLAHELGHYILHIAPTNKLDDEINDEKIVYNRDNNWNKIEMQANNFAAQLLMPSDLISNEIERIIIEHKKNTSEGRMDKDILIEKLAKEFQVSLSAMEFRLSSLGVNL